MNDESQRGGAGGMDRFTRNYLIFLGVLVLGGLLVWLGGRDTRVDDLNETLAADAELAGYAYPFRVLSMGNGVALLSTPRAFDVPVIRFLGVIHPELRGKDQDDPAVVAAQEELVRHQKRAMELVQQHPDVRSVRWELDKTWYRERGLSPN